MVVFKTGFTRRNSTPSSASAGCKPCKHPNPASTDLIHASLYLCHCAPTTTLAHIMPPPRLSPALLRARPQARYQCLRRIAPLRHASTTPPQQNDIKPVVPWKTPTSVWSPENLIPPPKDGEILLERRPNRALPPYVKPWIVLPHPSANIYSPKNRKESLSQNTDRIAI
jgi:hypothetical protein